MSILVLKAIKIKGKYIIEIVIVIILIVVAFIIISLPRNTKKEETEIKDEEKIENFEENNNIETEDKTENKNYIKWVDYNVPLDIMEKTAKLDINSHNKEENIKLNWIELISYLASKYGGNFKSFKQADLDFVVQKLREGETIENIVTNHKLYNYYIEAYTAVLEEFIGEYEIEEYENNEKVFKKKYGLKAFLPIAKNYGFSHYDDFGASRSYGYKRVHLGNDLMGSSGTPIIAIEGGIVEACRLESIWGMENRYKKFR